MYVNEMLTLKNKLVVTVLFFDNALHLSMGNCIGKVSTLI